MYCHLSRFMFIFISPKDLKRGSNNKRNSFFGFDQEAGYVHVRIPNSSEIEQYAANAI